MIVRINAWLSSVNGFNTSLSIIFRPSIGHNYMGLICFLLNTDALPYVWRLSGYPESESHYQGSFFQVVVLITLAKVND